MQVAAAILTLSLAIIAAAAPGRPDLPARLRGYREWPAGDVHSVSTSLSILCVALPEKELARRRAEIQKAHGPHAERYVRVYANPGAVTATRDKSASSFPVGSIIAKEKLLSPDAPPEAIAFMIKHPPGSFPESGDWEFRYYPEPREASYSQCAECHRTGAVRDYVFTILREPAADRSE